MPSGVASTARTWPWASSRQERGATGDFIEALVEEVIDREDGRRGIGAAAPAAVAAVVELPRGA